MAAGSSEAAPCALAGVLLANNTAVDNTLTPPCRTLAHGKKLSKNKIISIDLRELW